jgi:glucose/arabinose dehydrogenase
LQLERQENRQLPASVSPGDPCLEDPNLSVRTVVSGLNQPTTMAFLGPEDFFVLEKATGKVQHVVNGVVAGTVLDLAVNNGSERGLLGITLHPNFPENPGVYLYWTESTTGADTSVLSETPLLGNRVDRFEWDGTSLTFDQNLIQLRALQPAFDAEPTPAAGRGNHDGGIVKFGPDGKLYIFIGDVGRRGQTQNLEFGPFTPPTGDDDNFGGPEPDDAHMTGVVVRLNDDGTTPADNPFFDAGAALGGEVGENIQRIFSYGRRNSFGMDFDPVSGALWLEENGDDSFTELNRVDAGMNGGWIQIAGPLSRIAQFREIETTFGGQNLQQARWSPENIATTPEEVLDRLFVIPGSHYSDPEFSWKFEVAPAGIGFLDSSALGPQYRNDLFMGAARPFLEGGHLFHFNLTGNRQKIAVDDPRLEDRVADNLAKFEITESESLLFGRNFGVGTDIKTGPNGNLYVVSLSNGAVYEIQRASTRFSAELSGDQEVPPVDTAASGDASFTLSEDGTELEFELQVANIQDVTQAHIHLAPPGVNGPVVAFLFGFVPGGVTIDDGTLAEGTITEDDLIARPAVGFGGTMEELIARIRAGDAYVNVHTIDHPGGEIRGQLVAQIPGGKSRAARLDASGDGRLSAFDAMLIVNELNRRAGGKGNAAAAAEGEGELLDVSGDGGLSALDVVLIVNELNRQAAESASAVDEVAADETDGDDSFDALLAILADDNLRQRGRIR